MASITIRRLDDAIKTRLRVRAAHNGRSMEEEAREILKSQLMADASHVNLAKAIRQYAEAFGGVDLALPPRQAVRGRPKVGK